MLATDFVTQPGIDPAQSLAADRHFMHAIRRPGRARSAVLRVYDCAGDAILLGRYHLAPEPVPGAPVSVWRRHSGGRVVPFGDGFVGLSLVLPHRSAWYADDPFALAPYQVMNRYVRGVLESCRQVNLSAFYPGRDFVTIDRRVLGLVSFEIDEAGVLLFEAIIAVNRDFGVLPELLDAADPAGVVKIEKLPADGTTSLARELGAELGFDEVADMLRRGFAKQFGLQCEPRVLAGLETQAVDAVAAREFRPPAWLMQRRRRPDLDRHATLWAQLGAFEAYFALEQERFLKEIVFTGDFIANSPAIDELERDLRLCPADWRAIDSVANAVFGKPENFILGIGRLRTIADMITRGLAR